ncbi:MAG: DUF4838 domain-containing protein, partial [Thermoguttaceae bacterium]|nr:DUF4838 domain-containing protein [Thermoguttaceae bacterium]
GGITDYSIVLPETPTAVQQTAAEELASFLNQVTGTDFPILSESQIEEKAKDKQKLLVIGPGKRSKQLLASVGAEPEETLGQDGIILHTAGQSIVFSGHPDRGMLYAVYTFLEDYVGCRWWTRTESTIPNIQRLDITPPDLRYQPTFCWRDTSYLDVRQGEEGGIFCARRKINGPPVPPQYGGYVTICLGSHTFCLILPPKDFFDEHPDWYALVDGRRLKDNGQLCLTNPEMKQEFIRSVLRILDENPETKIISISKNDCGGWCQCPECQRLVDENGSQSGPLITFVNDVAEAVEKEHPDVVVETLAYLSTRFAPAKARPRDNVLIRLCAIGNSFLTPVEEGGNNQSLVEQIEKWSGIAKQLFVWDYVTNFSNYMLPHPNLQVLAPNIRFYARNHAVGIYEQADSWCAAGDFVRLRCYLISKLMWNPSLDQREIENDFLTGYYSPAVGSLLRQYLDLITETAVRSDINLSCYMETTYDWLDTAALVKATELMNRAIAAAEEDQRREPERFAGLADKVRRESIPIHLTWLLDWKKRQDDLTRQNIPSPVPGGEEYFEEFRTLLEKNNVDCAKEGKTAQFQEWLNNLHK